MKRILAILLMLVTGANAQTIVFFGAGDNIGNSRTNLNGNFSNILPVVQAAYSNTHVVTHQASETNFLQWVSRSSDGKTNYWLACFTNGGGIGASTPQGPWTNWIAGSTYGVSNAGTYNMADTNLVIFTVGTNKFMIQGTASQPTNVAWNGNSLINPAGGGSSAAYTDLCIMYATNTYTWNNATLYTQVFEKVGNNDAGVFQTNYFQFSSTGLIHFAVTRQIAGGAVANDCSLYLSKNSLLVNDGSYYAFAVESSYAPNGGSYYPNGTVSVYNDAATNRWTLILYQVSGGSRVTDAGNMGANWVIAWRSP